MNPGLVMLSGVIVVAGRWTRGQPLDLPAVVALFFVAIMVSILTEVNEEIGRGFAILILVGVVYVYGQDIAKAVDRATRAPVNRTGSRAPSGGGQEKKGR